VPCAAARGVRQRQLFPFFCVPLFLLVMINALPRRVAGRHDLCVHGAFAGPCVLGSLTAGGARDVLLFAFWRCVFSVCLGGELSVATPGTLPRGRAAQKLGYLRVSVGLFFLVCWEIHPLRSRSSKDLCLLVLGLLWAVLIELLFRGVVKSCLYISCLFFFFVVGICSDCCCRGA